LLLVRGTPYRDVASQTGLSRASIARHRSKCLVARLGEAAEGAKTLGAINAAGRSSDSSRETVDPITAQALARFGSAEDLLTVVEAMLGGIVAVMESAQRDGRAGDYLKATKELRETCAFIGKARGWISDGSATTIIDARRQTIALLGGMSESDLRALAASVTDNQTFSADDAEAV
jgi:hypothetical protein